MRSLFGSIFSQPQPSRNLDESKQSQPLPYPISAFEAVEPKADGRIKVLEEQGQFSDVQRRLNRQCWSHTGRRYQYEFKIIERSSPVIVDDFSPVLERYQDEILEFKQLFPSANASYSLKRDSQNRIESGLLKNQNPVGDGGYCEELFDSLLFKSGDLRDLVHLRVCFPSPIRQRYENGQITYQLTSQRASMLVLVQLHLHVQATHREDFEYVCLQTSQPNSEKQLLQNLDAYLKNLTKLLIAQLRELQYLKPEKVKKGLREKESFSFQYDVCVYQEQIDKIFPVYKFAQGTFMVKQDSTGQQLSCICKTFFTLHGRTTKRLMHNRQPTGAMSKFFQPFAVNLSQGSVKNGLWIGRRHDRYTYQMIQNQQYTEDRLFRYALPSQIMLDDKKIERFILTSSHAFKFVSNSTMINRLKPQLLREEISKNIKTYLSEVPISNFDHQFTVNGELFTCTLDDQIDFNDITFTLKHHYFNNFRHPGRLFNNAKHRGFQMKTKRITDLINFQLPETHQTKLPIMFANFQEVTGIARKFPEARRLNQIALTSGRNPFQFDCIKNRANSQCFSLYYCLMGDEELLDLNWVRPPEFQAMRNRAAQANREEAKEEEKEEALQATPENTLRNHPPEEPPTQADQPLPLDNQDVQAPTDPANNANNQNNQDQGEILLPQEEEALYIPNVNDETLSGWVQVEGPMQHQVEIRKFVMRFVTNQNTGEVKLVEYML